MAIVTGTDLDDRTLSGTSSADQIYGLAGKDRLYAKEGDDYLDGGAGNDLLDGGLGNDTMLGGSGDDTYRVDSTGDVVTELSAADGTDLVESTISYTLGSFLEDLTLTGSLNIDGTGNELANKIDGNSGNNTLSGGIGDDSLSGGAGNDILIGGAGLDSLTGGTGNDQFVFNFPDGNVDNVRDFAAGDVVGVYANEFGLTIGGGIISNSGVLSLDPDYFATISGTTNQGTVAGHGQFLYNTTSRQLFWDPDGSGAGAATAIAKFNTGTVLNASTFAILDTPQPALPTVSVSDASVTEGPNAKLEFDITLSAAATTDVLVNYTTLIGSATSPDDFTAVTSSVVITAGLTTAKVSVDVADDAIYEGPGTESMSLKLTSAALVGVSSLSITRDTAIGTITDNDPAPPPAPTVSISDATAAENAGSITFTVSLSSTATSDVTVNFSTANGSALAGSDYTSKAGSVIIGAGTSSATVVVDLLNDSVFEPNENFFVNLSGATSNGANLTLTDASGTGVITNDDPAPLPTVSVADASQIEGSGTMNFVVSLSQAYSAPITISYTTADIGGGASTPGDYSAKAGTVTIAAGDTSATVSVTLTNDTNPEGTETFGFNISGATDGTSNAVITDGAAVGTIFDDDPTGPPPLNVTLKNIIDVTQFKAGDPSSIKGSGDASGVAFVPNLNGPQGTIFIADSEHDESPYFSSVNLFAMKPDGTFIRSYSLTGFTHEPTGLAYNSINDRLYITDDDQRMVFIVNPNTLGNGPITPESSFSVRGLGITDAEDPKIDPVTGNIYMLDGASKTFFELTPTGSLVRKFALPSVMTDAEALAYDAQHQVFFVGSGATRGAIYEMDKNGNLLATITLLNDSAVNGGTKPKVKGLDFAPSSNPNDGNKLSLFVADYGADQKLDARVFELDLGSGWLVA